MQEKKLDSGLKIHNLLWTLLRLVVPMHPHSAPTSMKKAKNRAGLHAWLLNKLAVDAYSLVEV
jgi:hypothetical protein